MNSMRYIACILVLLAVADAGVNAQTRRRRPILSNDQQVRLLIRRIENHTAVFRDSVSATIDQGDLDTSRADDLNQSVVALQDATNRLRDDFNSRIPINSDVQNVLDRASRVRQFIQSNPLGGSVQGDWANLQNDLNELARRYGGPASPNNTVYPNQGNYGYGSNLLTGTFRLDSSRSDDPRATADRATQNLSDSDRQRVMDALTQRLSSPDLLAIDVRGRSVTIASSRAPQTRFEADGVERPESTVYGHTARVRATVGSNQLVVSSTGDRDEDFTVTLDVLDNGRRLRMTRQVSDINIGTPVIVRSYYDKTSETARFDVYNGAGGQSTSGQAPGTFMVPDGTQIVAILNDNLVTSQVSEGTRFTMNVQSPDQYNGAVIDGHISGVRRGGRVTGRSEMTLNFDDIRLRDGGTYQFAGTVTGVRTPTGQTVNVNNEGTVDTRNRTTQTEERAAIGTAVGAIIGAIAGGGKGAAIGAVLGAGTGAGSVYVQGKDDLNLTNGTQVTIQASAPLRR